jgi:hypothetical protein
MSREATDIERERRFCALLDQAPPPDWVVAMIEHYQRTGTYRSEDLRRLLGDPTKGFELRTGEAGDALLAYLQNHTS